MYMIAWVVDIKINNILGKTHLTFILHIYFSLPERVGLILYYIEWNVKKASNILILLLSLEGVSLLWLSSACRIWLRAFCRPQLSALFFGFVVEEDKCWYYQDYHNTTSQLSSNIILTCACWVVKPLTVVAYRNQSNFYQPQSCHFRCPKY